MRHILLVKRSWIAMIALPVICAASMPGQVDPLPQGDRGIASQHANDRGIASDTRVLLHEDFETEDYSRNWSMRFHAENIRIAGEPENVRSGKRSLEFTVKKQSGEMSNSFIRKLKSGHDALFLRYYSKFEEGFDQVGSSHNGGFLAAIAEGVPFATPGIKADGRNKFIASYENWRSDPSTPSPGSLNVYVYHPEQRSQWGDHFFPGGEVMPNTSIPGDFGPSFVKRPGVTQELGRWYCYEMMVKANTPNRRDGRIACWLDGKVIADFPNLRLRDDSNLKLNYAAIDLHIGSNRVRENKKYYDDVVLATSYVGPMLASK